MKRFYGLLMALMCLTYGQTLQAQCGASGTFTVGTCVGCGGAGTVASPYTGGGTVEICFNLDEFYEEGLNWAHGVALNTASSNYTVIDPTNASPIAAQTYNGVGSTPTSDHSWIPVSTSVTGTLLTNGPGWYVNDNSDGTNDPSDNFGDDGDNAGSGIFLSDDTYGSMSGVGPFCFSYMVPATGFGSFRPSVAVSGDGQTGAHLAPTVCSTLLAVLADESDRFHWGEVIVDTEPDCGTATQTSTFDFGGGVGSLTGSSCGVMEITEFALATGSSPMGSGTAADPYITPFNIKTCVDVKTFDENLLNWLHSVMLNNQTELPTGTVVTAISGEQLSAAEKIDADGHGGATNWLFKNPGYGSEPAMLSWPLAALGTAEFHPFPGFYADGDNEDTGTGGEGLTSGDGLTKNNFGDSGNGASGGSTPAGTSTTGQFLGTESFDLEPFCFNIAVGNDATQAVKRFRPQFNMAGDGSTGAWTVPTLECMLAAFIPTSCGPNSDGSLYYASAVDPETDCGTQNETVSLDIDGSGVLVTGAACGHMEVTEIGLVGSNDGAGTDADPYITPFAVKTCVDVKTFDESLVNWLHGVFIRNRSELPDGTTIQATGTGAQPTAAETLDAAANTGASAWIFVEVANEPASTTWATMVSPPSADGFHPYSGYYCDGGPDAPEADGDTKNNLGDNGNGLSGGGAATPSGFLLGDETYTLDPFCFVINVASDPDHPGGKFRPNFGMAGDGSTGDWAIPTLDCLLANFFPTECGPNGDGTFAYTTECPSSFTVALNNDDSDVFGGDAILSGTSAVSWDVTCATADYLIRGGADATDLVADMLWYDNEDDDNGYAPGCAPTNFVVDVSCETESTNPLNGLTFPVDCAAQANQITCKSQTLAANAGINHSLTPAFFDVLCSSTNDYSVPAGARVEDDCTADKMTFYFPTYDYDRNAGAYNDVPSTYSDYHPDCTVVRNDVVVLPAPPSAGTPTGGSCTPPSVDLIAADGSSVCDTKDMTFLSCDGPTSMASWTYTWTAAAISEAYTTPNTNAYAAAYSDVVVSTVMTTCNCAILLSEFTAFDANQRGNVNLLEWATASEENTKWHVIERSANGKDFEEIGKQNAQGNSSEIYNYAFTDANPLATSYYRIRSVDFDGKENMTAIRVVERKNDFDLEVTRLFPNPTSNNVKIEFDSYKAEKINIVVMDMFGKVVAQDVMETEDSLNTYNLDMSNFNNGVYMVSLDNGVNRVTKRVIKQQ